MWKKFLSAAEEQLHNLQTSARLNRLKATPRYQEFLRTKLNDIDYRNGLIKNEKYKSTPEDRLIKSMKIRKELQLDNVIRDNR